MRFLLTILAVLCAAGAVASDQLWQVRTHAQTSTVAVTADSPPFVGELDQVEVYVPANGTGSVAVVSVDPYSGTELVLATNAALTAYTLWRPRLAAVVEAGTTALIVTNTTASSERLLVAGETLRAKVAGANVTNAVWKFRVKYVK